MAAGERSGRGGEERLRPHLVRQPGEAGGEALHRDERGGKEDAGDGRAEEALPEERLDQRVCDAAAGHVVREHREPPVQRRAKVEEADQRTITSLLAPCCILAASLSVRLVLGIQK